MDEREALIQDIIDTPLDDAPRLAYADWQQRRGDPAHAELIRTQCELARLPENAPDRPALESRQAELLERPENASLTEYNEFTRGFVEEPQWYGEEDSFDYSGVPLERVLFLLAAEFGDGNWPEPKDAARLAGAAWTRRLRRVAFHEFGVDAEVVRTLAASPHLHNLREVGFSDCVTGPEALADLILGPSVRGVERLLMQGDSGDWGDLAPAFRRIFGDPRSGLLRRLRVTHLGAGPQLADALLESRGLDDLRLELTDNFEWLTPDLRAALRRRFGDRVRFVWGSFTDPYGWPSEDAE